MTDSLGSLVENLRPHPSSLRKQVEARHKSAGEFSFYGPAGSDFGQSLCKPRTRDAGHFSPGPARYNYLHMTPELVRHPLAPSSAAHASPRSSRRRNACGTSSSACARRGTTSRRAAGAGRASTRARARATSGGPTSSDVDGSAPPRDRAAARQVTRLNQHRAKQQDWPSSANFNTSDIQSKFTFEQYPRCNFGQSTTRGAASRRARRFPPETAPAGRGPSSTRCRTRASRRSGSGSGGTTQTSRERGECPPRRRARRGRKRLARGLGGACGGELVLWLQCLAWCRCRAFGSPGADEAPVPHEDGRRGYV